MVGPMYKYDPNLVSTVKFPPQYHGRLILSDWGLGTHVTVTLANSTKVEKLTPFNVSDNSLKKSDVAYRYGPKGELYVLQYSESRTLDANSALSRIDYTGTINPACFTAITGVIGEQGKHNNNNRGNGYGKGKSKGKGIGFWHDSGNGINVEYYDIKGRENLVLVKPKNIINPSSI
jgi:hypothetical protein